MAHIDLPEIPIATSHVLIRIVQEALSNIIRHAHASRCEIAVWQDDGALIVRIDDDGEGKGVRLGRIKENYFPVVWDANKLRENTEGFKGMLLGKYRGEIEKILNSLRQLQFAVRGFEGEGSSPCSGTTLVAGSKSGSGTGTADSSACV